jgi:serine phosphatase RsbU (regulator of sigma subunit)
VVRFITAFFLICLPSEIFPDEVPIRCGIVSGQVIRITDGTPADGIELQAKDILGKIQGWATTNFDGKFQIGLPPGLYEISIARSSKSSEKRKVHVRSGEAISGCIFSIESISGDSPESGYNWGLIGLGFLFAFTVLHFFIFLFERTQWVHLVYSVTLFSCTLYLWHDLDSSGDPSHKIIIGIIISLFFATFISNLIRMEKGEEENSIGEVSFFRVDLQDLKNKQKRVWLCALALLSHCVIFILIVYFPRFIPQFAAIFSACMLFYVISSVTLVKKSNSWILGVGFSFSQAIYISETLSGKFFNNGTIIGLVILAISMSLFLARTYARVNADNARKTEELEQARQLQISMLPSDKPSIPHLDIAWHMETATEVGGDYYDYSLDDDGGITITLGDATGHGMAAGTVVTATKSLFQNFADQPVITETFTAMSRSLKGMNFPRLGMAMTMCKITDHKLQISSAGIPPALLYRAATKEIEEIEIGGMPLGYSTSFQYQQEEYDLNPGDTLVLMSDGLPERLNDQDEELGYPKTQELFREAAEMAPDAICEHLAAGGDEWAKGRVQDDDVTFVVIKVK